MKLSLHSLAVAAVCLLATLSFSPVALACKCMMPSPADARDKATAVFEGHVTAIAKEGGEGAAGIGTHVVSLNIVRTWKGLESEETVQVRTASESAACGIMFEVGKSFLVYASDGEGGLQAGSCGRTREMSSAEEDLAVLGAGVTPVKIEPKPATATPGKAEETAKPPATRTSSCGYSSASKSAASSLLFAAPAVGLVVARRRRRP